MSHKENALTTSSMLFNPTKTDTYTYGSDWKDQLAEYSYDSATQSFAYDAIGNPTCYRGKEMTWLHRQLTSYDGIAYTYDANGQRTSKTRNGITYKYIYDGNSLVAEQHTNGSQTEWLYYLYGVEGGAGFRYNGKTYLYRKNLQGDVTHIYTRTEKDGVEFLTRVAHYDYDAYGNCKVLADVDGIATVNPFRYRSYYCDSDISL